MNKREGREVSMRIAMENVGEQMDRRKEATLSLACPLQQLLT